MEAIKIKTPLMKFQYWISWVSFILFGFLIVWLIALGLATYGKNTDYNVKKKKEILNKTWQKFVFIYGSVVGDIFILVLIIDLII